MQLISYNEVVQPSMRKVADNMEKEHPAKCQSALTVNHIVSSLYK